MNSAARDIRKIATAERRCRALTLRKAGLSYEQIAKQEGFSGKSAARQNVHDAIRDLTREPAKDVVLLELERLDTMLLALWKKAKSGDVRAIDSVLRIMERRSAYLGIDAPKKVAGAFDAALVLADGAHAELLGRLAVLTAAATKRDDAEVTE